MNYLIDIDGKDPVKSYHICWKVEEKGNLLILIEIVENYYEHPQAPEDALIPIIEKIERKKFDIDSKIGNLLEILKHSENIINNSIREKDLLIGRMR